MTLLTLNDAGQLSASFVNTETLQACEQKVMRIEGIFKTAGITIVESHCGLTEYQFSRFTHSQSSQVEAFSYQVRIDKSRVEVTPMDIKQCADLLADNPSLVESTYCATSTQEQH